MAFRSRKGISLAIETIVFIILAVTVLSVLLLFFTGTGGPAQTSVELENKRNIICGDYVRNYPKCDSPGTGLKDIDKLPDICKKLGTIDPKEPAKKPCESGNPQECFVLCCRLFCLR